MKIIRFICFLLLVSSVSVSAQKTTLKFNKYTWFEGLDKAKEQNKFFLTFVTQKGCDYCKELKEKTFTDPNLIAFLNEKFVLATHDVASKYGRALVIDHHLSTTPALLVQNPNSEKRPLIIYGVKDAETLKKELEELLITH